MESRIGVFVCNCGEGMKNIDFDGLTEKVAGVPGVLSVTLSRDLCLDEGREKMVSLTRDKGVDRVVIAACSPDLKEDMFRQALESAGLNGNLISMANIREQCSWVHDGDVTGKAAELVMMAIERARLLNPVERRRLPVNTDVLVIGGGFSAMSTALRLSGVGLRTTMLVREPVLGAGSGEMEHLQGVDAGWIMAAVEKEPMIDVLTCVQMIGAEGEPGNLTVKVMKDGVESSRQFGAIVLATGFRTELLVDRGSTDDDVIAGPSIVSQERLRCMLDSSSLDSRPAVVGFLSDLADEDSRFATLATLNSALAVKARWGSEVYVLCRDVKVDSEGAERLYRRARECGVVFVKYDSAPRIALEDGIVTVEARDVFVGEEMILACDLLVGEELLSPGEGAEALGCLFGLRLDSGGFYQDENVHLYPVSSERKGVFFVGGCRGNADITRVQADIASVVTRVCGLLCPGSLQVDMERVKVDPQKCVACLTCIRVCPHGAIRLVREEGGTDVAVVSDSGCDACGVCAAICPAKAIEFQGYRDDELLAQIRAAGAL